MTPTVSVIICTHDRPAELAEAVRTVLGQSEPPEELIVVNDGAVEVPAGVTASAGRAGAAYTVIRRAVASLPASRNRGIDAAAGEIVLLTDDDVVLPADLLTRLRELYRADSGGEVAGIGAAVVPAAEPTAGDRLWSALAGTMGIGRWYPRRCRARSVRLPAGLRGRLAPARRWSGACFSLRREVAAAERFDEAFGGYALGEDVEFCFRAGLRHGLFVAPELRVVHAKAAAARPDLRALGRMYVRNTLLVAASAGGGAGVGLMVAIDLAGTLLLHAAFLPLGGVRRHGSFMAGAVGGLGEALAEAGRRLWCGY